MLVRVMRTRFKTFALVAGKEEFACVFSPGIIAELVNDKPRSCKELAHWGRLAKGHGYTERSWKVENKGLRPTDINEW